MARERIAETRVFEIADAENVLALTKLHKHKMEKFGVTDAVIRDYEHYIEEAKKYERTSGPISLDDARKELKDHLGRYRKRADIAANSFEGPNEKLARTMRCTGGFPKSDTELLAAVDNMEPIFKANAALLAKVDFGPKEQAAFVKAASHFRDELVALPTRKGQQKAEAALRERAFERLRWKTGWLRRVGLEALEGDTAASGFHRIHTAVRPSRKPSVPPDPVTPPPPVTTAPPPVTTAPPPSEPPQAEM